MINANYTLSTTISTNTIKFANNRFGFGAISLSKSQSNNFVACENC